MTPQERLARSQRAEAFYREFVEPMFDELKNEYGDRIVHHATEELDPIKRRDKITALSVAMKIVNTLDAGMNEIIRDGELAKRELVKAERIEQMTAPQRRLLNIGGWN